MTAKPIANLGFLLAALVLAGCGTGDEVLYDVSGTATFDGKPIPKGVIFFDPDPTKGGAGGQGFANIWDGKYTTAEKGRGVRGGAYIIRLVGFDGKTGQEAPFGDFLFPEHQEAKELPKANSTLDFAINKKEKK
jgi:hypothetical protein